MTVNSVKRKVVTANEAESVPEKIKALRKRLGVGQIKMAELLGVNQGVVSGWENGKYPPSPMALMAIGRLDDDAAWWYEQAGPQFAEGLKTTRLINEIRAEKKERKETSPKLLAQVLDAVNIRILERQLGLTSVQKAQVYSMLYDAWRILGECKKEMVDVCIDDVCFPSNKKVRA